MIRRFAVCVIGALVICGSEQAAADLSFLSQTRTVEASYTFTGEGGAAAGQTVAPDFSLFDASIGFAPNPLDIGASQFSSMTGGSIIANGNAFVDMNFEELGEGVTAFAHTQSSFNLVFELSHRTAFTLTGMLLISGDTGGGFPPDAFAEVALSDVFTASIVPNFLGGDFCPDAGSGFNCETTFFEGQGFLEPGIYSLTAIADLNHSSNNGSALAGSFGIGGETRYSLNLELRPVVPIPSAVLLGALGLGMVGWVRRRF